MVNAFDRDRRITICGISSCFVLCCSLFAGGAETTNNPYASIAARNIFGISPPSPRQPVSDESEDPAEKITPNGIMSVLGKWQVLAKVSTVRPGQPPEEKSYILSEGEKQDGIVVLDVDGKRGIIKFNNHGIIQCIPLIAIKNLNVEGNVFLGNHLRRRIYSGQN
jgi:hypothetical protein